MKTILKYSLLGLVLSLTAIPMAYSAPSPTPLPPSRSNTAPEIDPSLAVSGLALLAGSLSVAFARRSKG